jgi:hypothetical protein
MSDRSQFAHHNSFIAMPGDELLQCNIRRAFSCGRDESAPWHLTDWATDDAAQQCSTA